MSKRPGEDLPGGAPTRVARENGQEDVRGAVRRKEGQPRMLIYKSDTEPLRELPGIWRDAGGEEVVLEVVIHPEHLTKENKRVKARQIWGDMVYTHDSDLVAVLMHMGYYIHTLQHAPQQLVETHATIRLVPSPESYPSKQRYVKSRGWPKPSDVCAYKVEKFWLVTRTGCAIEMQPCVDDLPAPQATVQPQASDRAITTRNTGARGRVTQEATIQYSLSNEPWLKYTLATVADKGLKPSQLTSARLLDHVLFVETATHRYQIARATQEEGGKETYSFSLCKSALPASVMQRLGLPLPPDQVEVLETGLEWEELKWGVSTVHVRSKEYVLRRMHMMRTVKAEVAV